MSQALEEGGAGGVEDLGFEQFESLLLRDEAQLDLYEMRAAVHDASGAGRPPRVNGQQGSPADGARPGCMGCCAF